MPAVLVPPFNHLYTKSALTPVVLSSEDTVALMAVSYSMRYKH